MDIHGYSEKKMEIDGYPGIFINFHKNPGYYRISGNPDFPDLSMEIHVCPSYHTWISNMVLLEKLVVTSIFHRGLSTTGRIRPVRRTSLPMVHYHISLFQQSTNYYCTNKLFYSYYYSMSSTQHTLRTKLLNNQL